MDRDWRAQMFPDISPSSFRDPAGYVFVDGGIVKRAVTVHGEADYRRFVGKLAKLSSYEPVDGRRHWTGRIVACDDGIVTLELVGEKASARVPLAKVSHGRLEVEFPKNG